MSGIGVAAGAVTIHATVVCDAATPCFTLAMSAVVTESDTAAIQAA